MGVPHEYSCISRDGTPAEQQDERQSQYRLQLALVKGSDHLKKVLPVLKEKLLAKGAVVNCDETWCRVKVAGIVSTARLCRLARPKTITKTITSRCHKSGTFSSLAALCR